jgi:hypothetical protein
MTDNIHWGVGNNSEEKAFDTTFVGKQQVELIFGEHPHSRQDNNVYARWKSGEIEGFDGHRLLHEITFRDYNYLKESELSGNEVRKGGECVIRINGHIVQTFFYRNIERALHKAAHVLDEIADHPIRLWSEQELNTLVGRKIYYRDQPAIVVEYIAEQSCVIIRSANGEPFALTAYDLECSAIGQLVERECEIKESIHSNRISWWREAG